MKVDIKNLSKEQLKVLNILNTSKKSVDIKKIYKLMKDDNITENSIDKLLYSLARLHLIMSGNNIKEIFDNINLDWDKRDIKNEKRTYKLTDDGKLLINKE